MSDNQIEKNNITGRGHTSQLSRVLKAAVFKKAFSAFLEQADKNAISGRSEGGQTPRGFAVKPKCDGADVSTHFGQGAASKTPYMNWWVVSIYYMPENGNIILGIEEDRYSHLKEMELAPLCFEQIGNKGIRVAEFYSTTRKNVNYSELLESFLNVCEEVQRCGIDFRKPKAEPPKSHPAIIVRTDVPDNKAKGREKPVKKAADTVSKNLPIVEIKQENEEQPVVVEDPKALIIPLKSIEKDEPIKKVNRVMANSIELREINKLIKEQFYIPTYQRGYRWDEQQVTELLEDIYEFMHKGNVTAGEFYCLQPIVVKKRPDGRYDVIDGQQRLTTFFIIQKCLGKKTFHIEYKREGSAEFLENIKEYVENGKEMTSNNIDFFFMTEAYRTVKDWFERVIEENEDYTLEDEFSTYLGKYCKVIWYDVDDDSDAESIFTRLNMGKIPLTNAELIKALFLRKSNFINIGDETYLRQLEIASEWDNIENTLQDDKVWYFINPRYEEMPATRIEYIFDIISGKTERDYSNHTFLYFADKLESSRIEDVWKEIKDYFRIIMEWYADQQLFHLIGFLTSSKSKITVKELIKEYYSNSYKKDEFSEHVIKYIRDRFADVDIDDLSYDFGPDKETIKDVLLLFNVITVMNKSSAYSRFPFDSYNMNRNGWSLEHIHAQNTEGIGNSKDLWLAWIDEHLKSFRQIPGEVYAEVVEKLEAVDREGIDKNSFEELFNEISFMIQDDYGIDLHNIDNLALLDKNANSSISNNFFDVKRTMIIEKDRTGEFIPVCTRNVFLKYYSSDPSQIHYWSETDRKDYMKAIKTVVSPYIEINEEEESDEQ